MSVLPLLTILISSNDRDVDRDLVRGKFSISVGLINAGSLFSYRVMHSYSLVEAIKYEFSLYLHYRSWIKHSCST